MASKSVLSELLTSVAFAAAAAQQFHATGQQVHLTGVHALCYTVAKLVHEEPISKYHREPELPYLNSRMCQKDKSLHGRE